MSQQNVKIWLLMRTTQSWAIKSWYTWMSERANSPMTAKQANCATLTEQLVNESRRKQSVRKHKATHLCRFSPYPSQNTNGRSPRSDDNGGSQGGCVRPAEPHGRWLTAVAANWNPGNRRGVNRGADPSHVERWFIGEEEITEMGKDRKKLHLCLHDFTVLSNIHT